MAVFDLSKMAYRSFDIDIGITLISGWKEISEESKSRALDFDF